MTFRRSEFAALLVLLLPLLGFVSTNMGMGQTQEQSPSALIRFLTYRANRPDKYGTWHGEWGPFNCGEANAEDRDNRAVAESLVKLGVAAIPDIEEALDSVETRGRGAEFATNAGWLVLAYARIRGPAAFPRLRRMISDPKVDFLRIKMDESIALSFGLTSYVYGFPPTRVSRCRPPEPRDALDQLILAWEGNDRPLFAASLGPDARAALKSLLKERPWSAMRAHLWHAKSNDRVAVGYRFEVAGRWSEPEETLEGQRGRAAEYSPKPELDTLFTDSSGHDCGRLRVTFLLTGVNGKGAVAYLVNDSNLGDLLRLIGACAAQ